MGGNHSPMVMGRDSNPRGCGFESRHRISDGYFHIYFCKKVNVCLKRHYNKMGYPIFKMKCRICGDGIVVSVITFYSIDPSVYLDDVFVQTLLLLERSELVSCKKIQLFLCKICLKDYLSSSSNNQKRIGTAEFAFL